MCEIINSNHGNLESGVGRSSGLMSNGAYFNMDSLPEMRVSGRKLEGTKEGSTAEGKSSAIGEALEMLRDELVLLQEQDVQLLKQLMNVHYSIRMLKRKLSRRTNSFTSLAPFSIMNSYQNGGLSSNMASRTLPSRASLSRVMSEPSNKSLMYQRSVSVEEEEEEEVDSLAGSFNSTASEESDVLKFSLNVDPEVSSLLTDMPKSLRKKYLASLNQNVYGTTTSGGYYSKPIGQKINGLPKCVHNESSRRTFSLKCSSNKVAVPNGLCKETLNEDLTDDSDSSGGIEITAL